MKVNFNHRYNVNCYLKENIQNQTKNTEYSRSSFPVPGYSVSFCSANPKKYSYDDFYNKLNEIYPQKKFNEILSSVVSPKNILGEGKFAIVYQFPGIDNYAVKIYRKNSIDYNQDIKSTIMPVKELSQKYSFGEPIAKSELGFEILKKVNGHAHSIENWFILFHELKSGSNPIKIEDARRALEALKVVEKFPLESYVQLASKIKYLREHTNKIVEACNPNNLLIDESNKDINIVDLGEDGVDIAPGKKNGYLTIILLLLDCFMQKTLYSTLSLGEQKDLYSVSTLIIKKCKKAAKIAGLPMEKESLEQSLKDKDKTTGNTFKYDIYKNFYDIYKETLAQV